MKMCRPSRLTIRSAFSVLLCLFFSSGCDKIGESVKGLKDRFYARSPKSAYLTDTQRVITKLGEPKEKLGLGKSVRSEQGIRYNRKWNYYYGKPGQAMTMRTVYFVDGKFTGSVLRQPDGTAQKETLVFPY